MYMHEKSAGASVNPERTEATRGRGAIRDPRHPGRNSYMTHVVWG